MTPPIGVTFIDVIQPYIKARLLSTCPSASSTKGDAYAINPQVATDLNLSTEPVTVNRLGTLAALSRPAESLLIGESVQAKNGFAAGFFGENYKWKAWREVNGDYLNGFWDGYPDGAGDFNLNNRMTSVAEAVATDCPTPYRDGYDWGVNGWDSVCGAQNLAVRHQDGSNVVWADGHAKYLKLGQFRLQMFRIAALNRP